jgi:hypothetical protein
MVTRSELSDNRLLSKNIGVWTNVFNNTRALVLDRVIPELSTITVKDFYNIVILETTEALVSVPIPDYLVLSNPTPYTNNVLTLDNFFGNTSIVFCTNYDSIIEFKKLRRTLDFFSSNFLPSTTAVSNSPVTVRKTESGLNQNEPGVHLAKILGCSEIQYTGSSTSATTVGFSQIKSFTEERDRFAPRNLVGLDRPTVLENL